MTTCHKYKSRVELSKKESARLPSPASSQVPDPSPDSKRNKREHAPNRQAHQSTPLLENCVALIRHVVQQLVHLRVFENERLPTLQADQNVTSNFHKPPFSNHARTVVAGVQLKTEPKTHMHSGKSVTARSRGKTSLATSLAWLMCHSLHAQYNEAQAAPKSTPTWLSRRCSAHFGFRKCAVAWTKWPRAHPSSFRPPACTYARTCDPHTLTSVCHNIVVGEGGRCTTLRCVQQAPTGTTATASKSETVPKHSKERLTERKSQARKTPPHAQGRSCTAHPRL